VELDTLDLYAIDQQEETSKDAIGLILNILIITTIVTLVMFFVFIGIEILAKAAFFKHLAMFSFLLFIIAGVGVIIACSIQLVRFFRLIIKGGKLMKVLKRFILIYTLSFTAFIAISFIIGKGPEWISSIIKSVLIAISIFFYTEVGVFYKELKKEYSLNTSSGEGDRE
jgi:hypothetical protein